MIKFFLLWEICRFNFDLSFIFSSLNGREKKCMVPRAWLNLISIRTSGYKKHCVFYGHPKDTRGLINEGLLLTKRYAIHVHSLSILSHPADRSFHSMYYFFPWKNPLTAVIKIKWNYVWLKEVDAKWRTSIFFII